MNPKDDKDRDGSQRFVEGSDRGIAMVAMDFGQARRNPSYTSLLFGKKPIWQISDIKDVCSHAFIACVRRKSWPGGVLSHCQYGET